MKMKTADLTGAALDWAVSAARGDRDMHHYSTDWAEGGPLIEREAIEVRKGNPLYFPQGEKGDFYEPLWIAGKQHGQTPLIAAMRCYVAANLGDEVDVPNELINQGESK